MSCDGNCSKCTSKGSCGTVAAPKTEQNLKIASNLGKFGHIYLILSGKGGVGKSTVSSQLSYYLADKLNKKVALMDIDICGPSIPTMTHTVGESIMQCAEGLQPVCVTPNLQTLSIGFMLENSDDAVILRGPKKHGAIQQFLMDTYWDLNEEVRDDNYLIIDTPPGTSDEHLSAINLIKGCCLLIEEENRPWIEAIIVSTPQEVALSDVRKELNFCKKIQIDVKGVVENMSGFVCPCCNKETLIFHPSSGGCQKLCQDFGITFLGRIPLDPVLTQASEQGKAWSQLADNSVGLQQFDAIAQQLIH